MSLTGNISGCLAKKKGGGLYNRGELTLVGDITDCNARLEGGGGVFTDMGYSCIMGNIINCTAKKEGAAVHTASAGHDRTCKTVVDGNSGAIVNCQTEQGGSAAYTDYGCYTSVKVIINGGVPPTEGAGTTTVGSLIDGSDMNKKSKEKSTKRNLQREI
jgi:hypothetical protein